MRNTSLVHWPKQIKKENRIALSTAHRSFLHLRRGSWRDLLWQTRVKTTGYVLGFALIGEIRIGTGLKSDVAVNAPILLLPGEHTLSELPDPISSQSCFAWYFFGDSVLAQIDKSGLDFLGRYYRFARYPINRCFVVRSTMLPPGIFEPEKIKHSLRPLLLACLNSLSGQFLRVFIQQVVTPRSRIELFLEKLILRNRSEHSNLLAAYPGGTAALRRQMNHLNMPSVAEIVTARRRLLFQDWKSRGATMREMLDAFRIASPGRIGRPQAYGTEKTDSTTFRIGGLDFYCEQSDPEDLPQVNQNLTGGKIDFRDTALAKIISMEDLCAVPGLEDCRKILEVA